MNIEVTVSKFGKNQREKDGSLPAHLSAGGVNVSEHSFRHKCLKHCSVPKNRTDRL